MVTPAQIFGSIAPTAAPTDEEVFRGAAPQAPAPQFQDAQLDRVRQFFGSLDPRAVTRALRPSLGRTGAAAAGLIPAIGIGALKDTGRGLTNLMEFGFGEGDRKLTTEDAMAVPMLGSGVGLARAALSPARGVGVFGGRLARDFPGDTEQAAFRLGERLGVDPEVSRGATGLFRGVDEQLRFEIDDSAARFTPEAEETIQRFAGSESKTTVAPSTLGEIIDHPGLFSNYPGLRNMRIAIRPAMENNFLGSFDPNANTITVATKGRSPEEIKSTLLHEVQHAVQRIEHFARGGNPGQFQAKKDRADALIGTVNNKLRSLSREMDKIRGADTVDNERLALLKSQYDTLIDSKIRDLVPLATADTFDQYRRLAGEVEARLVQTRMDFTDAMRRGNDPRGLGFGGQDVDPAQQIVMGVQRRSFPGDPNDPIPFSLGAAPGTGRGALPFRRSNEDGMLVDTAKVGDADLRVTFDEGRRSLTANEDAVDINFGLRGAAGEDLGFGDGRLFTMSPRQQMSALATVEKSVNDFVKAESPNRITFQAARPELRPLYDRLAARLAKSNDGVVIPGTKPGVYDIQLGNRTISVSDLPAGKMSLAIDAVGGLSHDQKQGVLRNVAEMLSESGSAKAVRRDFEFPRGFERHHEAALDALSANSAPAGLIPALAQRQAASDAERSRRINAFSLNPADNAAAARGDLL